MQGLEVGSDATDSSRLAARNANNRHEKGAWQAICVLINSAFAEDGRNTLQEVNHCGNS
jgi:hypothetical protein